MEKVKITKEYILNCLDKYCHFSKELCDNSSFADIVEPLQTANCFEAGSWTWDSGVSKLVLIFSGLNFVVKIPFVGEEEWEEYYDEETDEYIEEKSKYCFYPFHLDCAPDRVIDRYGSDNWDYCDIEADRYNLASDRGLKECFAKTEFLGWAQHYPIYIQERAVMFDSDEEKTKRTSNKEFYELDSNKSKVDSLREKSKLYINSVWTLDFFFYYGEDMFEALGKFCAEVDIDDLHCGNLGYINGRPCLVDYSSYYGT